MGITRGSAKLLLEESKRRAFEGSVLELGKMFVFFDQDVSAADPDPDRLWPQHACMPPDGALGQNVVELVEPLPHHLLPIGPAGLLEVDERVGVVGVAGDIDVSEADGDVVVEAERRLGSVHGIVEVEVEARHGLPWG